jgi:uncharacterized protein YggE
MKGYSGFRKVTIMALTLLCCMLSAASLHAGEAGISVSASSTVTYSPDTAEFMTVLESTDKDAARAAAKVATLWNSLQQALRQAGIPAADATSSNYTVNPEWEWNSSNGKREFRGYKARHVVNVTVRDLRKLGGAIDAVAGAGASTVDGLRYSSSSFENLRMQALANAVTSARKDADVMAKAAGGRLGLLVELQYGQSQPVYPVMRAALADGLQAAPSTDVQPGEQKLSVSVSSRWQFVSGGGK